MLRTRIINTILVSEQSVRFEDVERFRCPAKQRRRALILVGLIAVVAVLAAAAATEEWYRAKRAEKVAEDQRGIAERIVNDFLFQSDASASDKARDLFYTARNGSMPLSSAISLLDRAVAPGTTRHAILNALRILECFRLRTSRHTGDV